LKFDLDSKNISIKLKTKFNNNMREVLKPNIEFTFDNKYNLLKLFSEKYPELYKKNLIIDIILLNMVVIMVDFTDEFVKYSEWDFDDESGTEKKVCRIEDLIK
jgi:hypothetical protein